MGKRNIVPIVIVISAHLWGCYTIPKSPSFNGASTDITVESQPSDTLYKAPSEVHRSDQPDTTSFPLKFADGYVDGLHYGERSSTDLDFVTGYIGGALCGIIGTGVVILFAEPASLPKNFQGFQGKRDEYKGGFIEGFEKSSKEKKRANAVWGSVAGMATTAILIYHRGY